jgi:hypothetical protein
MKQFIVILMGALSLGSAFGQTEMPLSHGNTLGLPLVPQVPVKIAPKGTSSAVTTPARKSAPVVSVKPDPKASLSGPVSMASYYEPEGVIRVRVTTGTRYPAGEARKTALAGALLMQRDVVQSCGKLCKSMAMPAPVAMETGQLQIDLLIQGLNRKLSGPDMIQMVKGLPLAESTDEEKAALAPPVVVNVSKIAAAAPVTTTTSAATPAEPAPASANAPMVIQVGPAVASASNRETRTSGTSSLIVTP